MDELLPFGFGPSNVAGNKVRGRVRREADILPKLVKQYDFYANFTKNL